MRPRLGSPQASTNGTRLPVKECHHRQSRAAVGDRLGGGVVSAAPWPCSGRTVESHPKGDVLGHVYKTPMNINTCKEQTCFLHMVFICMSLGKKP